MALTLKELISSQQKLREQEGTPEKISIAQLNELAAKQSPTKLVRSADDNTSKIIDELEKLNSNFSDKGERSSGKKNDTQSPTKLVRSADDNTSKIIDELKKLNSNFLGKGERSSGKKNDTQSVLSELRIHTALLTDLEQKFKKDHSYQILGELKQHTKIFENGLQVQAKTEPSSSSYEDSLENKRTLEHQTALLEKLVDNTAVDDTVPTDTQKKTEFGGIGGILTGLAVSLGAVAGYISGYVKMLKSLVETITPNKLLNSFKTGFNKLENFFKSIGEFVGNQFDKFKKIFSFGTDSKIGVILEGVKKSITSFFDPIIDGWKTIKSASASIQQGSRWIAGLVETVSTFFSGIANSAKGFVNVFKGVFKIFQKLALPLTVIMSIWDTVKGSIEGFEKDGIVGAIKGAISGLINSLIMAPLDMLKSAVSWVVGAFGFENAEKFLDSFSFEDLFKQFVDAIFSPVETLKKMFNNAASMLQQISIPEISFTIPVIDKKVSIGPFYPFGEKASESSQPSAGSTDTAKTNTKSASQVQTVDTVSDTTSLTSTYSEVQSENVETHKSTAEMIAPPQTAANAVYSKSANNAAESGTHAISPVIVNAPTNVNNSTSKQNITMPAPIRNSDAGLSGYLNRSAVFV